MTSEGHRELLGSKLHDKSKGQNCCGLESYNFKEHLCCDGIIIPKPDVPNKASWMTCCGGQVLTNETGQLCVNDKILERPDKRWLACGSDVYNSKSQLCCHDKIYDKNSDMDCCDLAHDLYNKTIQQCCHDTIQEMSEEDLLVENGTCCAAAGDQKKAKSGLKIRLP